MSMYRAKSKFEVNDFVYKWWPVVPIVIAIGYLYFTSYRTLPSLLLAYAFGIIGIRLFHKVKQHG